VAVDNRGWVSVRSLDDFAEVRDGGSESSPHWWPDIGPTRGTDSLSFTHRMRRLGPITVLDIDFPDEVWVNGGENRPHYHVTVPVGTPSAATDDNPSLVRKPGAVSVYRPEGNASVSRYAGRLLAVMIDRHAVEDALAGVRRRPITSQIARSWINMVTLFAEQLFAPGSTLHQPMVGLPFADSVVHGLLPAADHPYREALASEVGESEPRAIRAAIDVIETEADQPLTVSALAERSYVSVRSLQLGFRHHLGITPMAYLREVRLRRATRCFWSPTHRESPSRRLRVGGVSPISAGSRPPTPLAIRSRRRKRCAAVDRGY
jgi:hypothetical protein